MANVIIANVTYSDVPAVDISKVGGGTARFYDDSGTITITQNGTHDVKGKGSAVVNVPSTPTQTKSATYNANGSYTVTPDSGYAMSSVSVTVAIPTYDGSVS